MRYIIRNLHTNWEDSFNSEFELSAAQMAQKTSAYKDKINWIKLGRVYWGYIDGDLKFKIIRIDDE